ncbi:MAG: SHOCT domain-containing protein [Mangrovibacterium sp.]
MKEKTKNNVVAESKKHWIAYVLPIFGTLFGLMTALVGSADDKQTIFGYLVLIIGLIILLMSFNAFWRIKSCRWILTEEELIIKSGFLPWRKSYFDIPMEDIYESYVSFGFWGKMLGYAQLTIRRTEGVTSHFSSNMMVNHTMLMRTINAEVRKLKKLSRQVQTINNHSNLSVSDELLKLKDLLNSGVISEEEFETLKKNLVG